jgi:hypothetical protein
VKKRIAVTKFIKPVFLLAVCLVASQLSPTNVLRRTDRDDVRRGLEDGWVVSYGKEIDHGEYLLRDGRNTFERDAVLKALGDGEQTFGAGSLELQGGIATYKHWTVELDYRIDPTNGVYEWSTVKVPCPNTYQPYVRWRRRSGDGGGNGQASRTSFVTASSGTYDGRAGGTWAKRERGREYTFREVQRTGDYIELTCVSGDHHDVRIYDDHVWYRQRDDRGVLAWRTSPDSKGSWR